MKISKKNIYRIAPLVVLVASAACSSNNCPLNNVVTCNCYFYDSEGTAISYSDEITVKALLPGTQTTYTYRKPGQPTVVTNTRVDSLLEQGYVETIGISRKDTVLVNKAAGKSYLNLPMSYFTQCDTIMFSYAGISGTDTLYISHDNYPYVGLPECGSYMFHTITNVRNANNSGIDHVEIANPKVDYEGKENIKIYFYGTAQ